MGPAIPTFVVDRSLDALNSQSHKKVGIVDVAVPCLSVHGHVSSTTIHFTAHNLQSHDFLIESKVWHDCDSRITIGRGGGG